VWINIFFIIKDKHDVVVSGGGGAAPKTVIYVKPAKNTNEVNIVDQTQPSAGPQKPTLYFLKGAHGNEQEAERDAQPVAPPPASYLPPSNPAGYQ
jgi:succinate dehydrogenase/fumarate reductase flavoprotein subunit